MNKKAFYLVLIAAVLTLAAVTYYYWYQNENYIVTDDARVDGDVVKVSPQITAKIIELPVEENQYLNENGFIARQSDVTLPTAGTSDLAVIRAPISGTVIKKTARVGEIGVPGVAVVMMADLKKLYITANIEEDKLVRVKPGQPVEFTLDTFSDLKFQGRVVTVGEAANSVFSLLPQQNTGNSYTKIVQRVPVKISIDDYQNQRLLPGINAVVKIHIR